MLLIAINTKQVNNSIDESNYDLTSKKLQQAMSLQFLHLQCLVTILEENSKKSVGAIFFIRLNISVYVFLIHECNSVGKMLRAAHAQNIA